VVADTPACLASGRKHLRFRNQILLWGWAAGALGCVEIENLAISAGAPVTVAVRVRITDCGHPVSGAEVVLRVQQDEPYQTHPVDVEVGPAMTDGHGKYVVEIEPAFAVPGPARVELRSVNGVALELPGPQLSFTLGSPPRDTARFDADLGSYRGTCPPVSRIDARSALAAAPRLTLFSS
jgi:hypothetical protein